MSTVVKNTRVETNEDRHGRIRERTVTTWDVVESGTLIGEFRRKRDALAAVADLSLAADRASEDEGLAWAADGEAARHPRERW